jgi:hypothetical protein
MTGKHAWQHSWACNLKNVAPQKQNTICKTRAQDSKRNCAFELLKRIVPQQLMLRSQVFTQIFLKRKERNRNFIKQETS